NPNFPQDEFSKMLKLRLDALKSSKDQAQAVIGTYFNAYLYGHHPYGRPITGDEKSLAGLTRDDVQKFYQTYYSPGNIIMPVAEVAPVTGKRLLLIDKPDSTQTYYRIGNIGITRTNPDRVYLEVVNTLFGGRFTSMLNSELRIKNGLTYGA